MQKDKAIFFGILGAIFICLIIYIVFSFGKRKDDKSYREEFQAPNLEETKKAYNSRIDALTKNKYDVEEKANPLRYDFLTDSTEIKAKADQVKRGKHKKETGIKTTQKEEHVRKNEGLQNPKKQTIYTSAETNNTIVREPVKKEGPDQNGGFGIYTSQNKKVEQVTKENTTGKYYKAFLEQDTKVVNGRTVVFILSEDAQIEGKTFKKNSVLYGKAVDKGSFFDIPIENIRNVDGNACNQSGIYVFNEYYNRGIDHVGNLNEAIREGTSQTLYDETGNITGTSVERGVDVALSAVDNTVRSLKGKKEISTDLYQGYVIYIKKIK